VQGVERQVVGRAFAAHEQSVSERKMVQAQMEPGARKPAEQQPAPTTVPAQDAPREERNED
jgi:hypothetical protein